MGAIGQASSVYSDFLAAVRDVNARLAADQRLGVLAGEPAIDLARNPSAVDRGRSRVLWSCT